MARTRFGGILSRFRNASAKYDGYMWEIVVYQKGIEPPRSQRCTHREYIGGVAISPKVPELVIAADLYDDTPPKIVAQFMEMAIDAGLALLELGTFENSFIFERGAAAIGWILFLLWSETGGDDIITRHLISPFEASHVAIEQRGLVSKTPCVPKRLSLA